MSKASAYPLTERGFQWAEDVLKGKIPSCEFVKMAVDRFARDLARKKWKYVFDPEESERWLSFLAQLPHVKGGWSRRSELFDPAGFQCFCTANLYGWRNKETGLRRFLEGYIELPRKNGKSFWAAGLGLGHLCIDGEAGAEVYCGATTEKQAWEVFRPARLMCIRTPDLCNEFGIEVNAKSLWILEAGARFEPLIGNPGDGPGPSAAIIDEFHEHKTGDLVDTMETGMGAREQPLLLIITTAGSDFGGPCREKRDDILRVLKQTVKDETVFGIIFTIDDGDAWDTEDALKKANPNFGVSVGRDYLIARMKKARRSATKQNAFKTKHLDLWVGAKTSWMNMLALQRCKRPRLKLEKFKGYRAWLGVDLASRVDIASVAILIPQGESINAFYRHYLPEDAVYEEVKNDRYKAWAESGQLITTPGNVIDFDIIEEDLKDLASDLEIVEVGFDPYQATQFSVHMIEEGFQMVEVRPTVLNFSEPMKEFEARILKKQFRFNGDPVFTWMMGNVVAHLDKKDNIYPNKEREENKIDGVVATIMAMNRWMASKDDQMPDDYELTVV